MKRLASILLAIPFLLLGSCQNEELTQKSDHSFELEAAVYHGDGTRAGFDKQGKFFWSEGDQIGVILGTANTFTEMTLNAGVGKSNATFTGTGTGTIGQYAVYPYAAEHQLHGTTLTYHLPATTIVDASKVETDFFSLEQGKGNSFNVPMYGTIEGEKVSFKHLGGVLCLKLDNLEPGDLTIKVESEQKMAGAFTAKLSDPEPKLTTQDGASSVTLKVYGMNNQSTGVFFVPVPTGTYNQLKVTVSTTFKTLYTKNFGKVTIHRKDLHVLSTIKKVTTSTAANEALVNGDTSVEIDNESEVTGTATLELVSTPPETPLTITYKGKHSGTIDIKEKASHKGASKVNLQMNGNQSGTLNIQLPNSTVQLNASAATVFANATVKTAANTFVVGSGVTIQNLTVEGGSVVLKKGSTVNAISKNGTFECNLYIEAGATPPATVPEGINKSQCVELINSTPQMLLSGAARVGVVLVPDLLPAERVYIDSNFGICYSTTETPTVADQKVSQHFTRDLTGKYPPLPTTVPAELDLTGLTPNTTYYYRAYCILPKYGDEPEKVIYGSVIKSLKANDIKLSTEEVVDLGLSVNWRNWNLGATKPEELGNEFYWGATAPSAKGDAVNTKDPNSYDASTRVLKPEADAAAVILKGSWRMPTEAEVDELKKKCNFCDYILNGQQGSLVIGPNGNCIFLPKKWFDEADVLPPNKAGYYLGYWTSSRYESDESKAHCLTDATYIFDMGSGGKQYYNGLTGETPAIRNALYNIRPVCPK